MTDVDPVVAEALDRAADGPLTLRQAGERFAELTTEISQSGIGAAHLEALRAATCFELTPEGKFKGHYAGKGPAPWPQQPEMISAEHQAIWRAYAEHALSAAVSACPESPRRQPSVGCPASSRASHMAGLSRSPWTARGPVRDAQGQPLPPAPPATPPAGSWL